MAPDEVIINTYYQMMFCLLEQVQQFALAYLFNEKDGYMIYTGSQPI